MFLSFFVHYLFSSRSISLIRFISMVCILGFAISLSGLIVIFSVMSGFGLSTQNRLLAEEPHLVVYGDESHRSSLVSSVQKVLTPRSQIIQRSQFFETQDAVLQSQEGSYIGVLAKGYPLSNLVEFLKPYEDSFLKEMNPSVEWDSSLKNIEEKKNPQGIPVYLSSDLSYLMNLLEGDTFHIMPVDNLLLPPTEMTPPEQVYLYSSLNFDLFSRISRTLFYELDTLYSLKETSSFSYGVEIFLKNPNDFFSIQKTLEENFFQVESWRDRHSALFFALKLEKAIMTVFLFLAIWISSFSIASMTRLLLAQKKNDINILRVMGWPVQKIRYLFLKISLSLSFVGVILGLCLAWGVCLFLEHNTLPLLPSIYYDRQIPVDMDIFVFIFSALLTFFLAFFISWFSVFSYTLPSSLGLKKSF